jgi:lactoylglutathione lyase
VIVVDTLLSLLVLKTLDVEKLCGFYRAIGVQLVEEQHGTGPRHYSGQVGGVLLEIYPLPSGDTAADTTTRLGFSVNAIDEVIEELRAIEAVITTPPRPTEWGLRAFVRDPDGRTVELYQR